MLAFCPQQARQPVALLLGAASGEQVMQIAVAAFLRSPERAEMLDDVSVPMLYLETDFSPEDVGQLSTRIEAFLESIKNRRRRKKK